MLSLSCCLCRYHISCCCCVVVFFLLMLMLFFIRMSFYWRYLVVEICSYHIKFVIVIVVSFFVWLHGLVCYVCLANNKLVSMCCCLSAISLSLSTVPLVRYDYFLFLFVFYAINGFSHGDKTHRRNEK